MRNCFLLFICFVTSIFAVPIQDHRIDPVALTELASALGCEGDLLSETQKHWLRKPGQERWEVEELSPEQRCFVLDWAQNQGLFTAWEPACTSYDKVLILGATTCRMQKRLDLLKQLWDEGVRFNKIVWLTGERPLDPRIDQLTDCCKTESEAARVLWKETSLPDEMRSLPIVFVAAPMNGQLDASELSVECGKELAAPFRSVKGSIRPNTADTIALWLNIEPEPCKVLFLSDQPFCGYQFAIVKNLLPEAFLFDFAGQGVDPMSYPSAAAITLDTIARWIYQDRL